MKKLSILLAILALPMTITPDSAAAKRANRKQKRMQRLRDLQKQSASLAIQTAQKMTKAGAIEAVKAAHKGIEGNENYDQTTKNQIKKMTADLGNSFQDSLNHFQTAATEVSHNSIDHTAGDISELELHQKNQNALADLAENAGAVAAEAATNLVDVSGDILDHQLSTAENKSNNPMFKRFSKIARENVKPFTKISSESAGLVVEELTDDAAYKLRTKSRNGRSGGDFNFEA